MKTIANIAWLAGIIDGEGCFSVKNPVRRGARGRTCHQVWLVLCNTSERMMKKAADIIEDLGCKRPQIRKVWKGQKATRYQFWINIAQKDDLLTVTSALVPHLVSKKLEAMLVQWFLLRACSSRSYKRTEVDSLVLNTLSAIKRCSGEAPAEVSNLLREVIPNEAFPELHAYLGADGGNERVETRRVSLNDNPAHECPTPKVH